MEKQRPNTPGRCFLQVDPAARRRARLLFFQDLFFNVTERFLFAPVL